MKDADAVAGDDGDGDPGPPHRGERADHPAPLRERDEREQREHREEARVRRPASPFRPTARAAARRRWTRPARRAPRRSARGGGRRGRPSPPTRPRLQSISWARNGTGCSLQRREESSEGAAALLIAASGLGHGRLVTAGCGSREAAAAAPAKSPASRHRLALPAGPARRPVHEEPRRPRASRATARGRTLAVRPRRAHGSTASTSIRP